MFILKEVTKAILNVSVFLLLPLVVVTLITSKVSLGGVKSFVVLTGSMSPLIPQGSVVYTSKQNEYKKGDIITFEQNGVTVTHRVVNKVTENNSTLYETQGDANTARDSGLVPSANIVGKVELFIPVIGKIIMFLKTLPGFFTLIILPTLIFVGFELFNIRKEIEKEVEKKVLRRMSSNG
ncbi:signal peptidase I [Candidatus Daviesbacteria bacterium]|nr:signal peptidase I [Candidatus Daviesbacteria bacterium]